MANIIFQYATATTDFVTVTASTGTISSLELVIDEQCKKRKERTQENGILDQHICELLAGHLQRPDKAPAHRCACGHEWTDGEEKPGPSIAPLSPRRMIELD